MVPIANTSGTVLTTSQATRALGLNERRVRTLCEEGRIEGAYYANGQWHIPTPITVVASKRGFSKLSGARVVPFVSLPTVPPGRFRCHVIDPPWPMAKIHRVVRPNQVEMDYPVMTVDQIVALPVAAKSEMAGAHLYLWTTQAYLPDALRIVQRWGFRYQCLLTWVKAGGMTPYSWQYNTEHVIFATVGDLALNRLGLKLSFNGDRREHSRKPETFYSLVLKASPGPRLEWFAREQREGFVVWGNETDKYSSGA